MVTLKTYRQPKFGIFDHLIKEIEDKYDMSLDGISSIISALKSHRDYITVLFADDGSVLGAISYYVTNKSKSIEIDHLGTIEHGNGHGTLLMEKVFRTAMRLDKSVSLMANGSANEFYEKIGMRNIGNKPIAIYELSNYEINNRYQP